RAAPPCMFSSGQKSKSSQRANLVRFSNRPFGVKHFQAIHHCRVDVARGLALLFGIGTRPLPSCDSRTRWNNLHGGLPLNGRSKRTSELTLSIVPRGTSSTRGGARCSPIVVDPLGLSCC